MRYRRRPTPAAVIVATVVALLAAGYGATSSTTAAATRAQSGALTFSRCMRSRGGPNFPDRNSSETLPKATAQQLRVTDSRLDTAGTACAHLNASSIRTPKAGPTTGTADCISVATCYTPQQLEVAYGVQPLLQRGIDGRGETVVLPELAESQLSPPRSATCARTLPPSTVCSTCRRRA